jgi:hypothetical protein
MNPKMKIATFIIFGIFIYLAGVTFLPDSFVSDKFANRIITYMQTILTLLIGYYWGTSTKTQGVTPPEEKMPAGCIDLETKPDGTK